MALLMNCPECGTEMVWKGFISSGDEEGRNSVAIYQCPKCKNIEVPER